jgi:uncharacterized membrane protein YiaA
LSGETTRQLFAAPVPSLQGLGVGLYQAARQAQAAGYHLAVLSNVKGRVCFALTPEVVREPMPKAAPESRHGS